MSQRTADGFRQFVYQGPDMLKLQMERDESEETVAHYTIGSGLEAMRRATSSFYHYNHLGTTVALTGANEAVTDTYRHDAWGVLLASTGSTVNPHTYVGRERYYRMPNAEMHHLGFRDYAQGVGRFTTVDPAFSHYLAGHTRGAGMSAYAKRLERAQHELLRMGELGSHQSPQHPTERPSRLAERYAYAECNPCVLSDATGLGFPWLQYICLQIIEAIVGVKIACEICGMYEDAPFGQAQWYKLGEGSGDCCIPDVWLEIYKPAGFEERGYIRIHFLYPAWCYDYVT